MVGLALTATGAALPLRVIRADEIAPPPGTEIPFELVDTKGEAVRGTDLRGRWVLVFFGYTFCPDLCPTVLNEVAGALAQLGPLAARVQPVFVSIDPQRDTPEALREYVQAFDERSSSSRRRTRSRRTAHPAADRDRRPAGSCRQRLRHRVLQGAGFCAGRLHFRAQRDHDALWP